MASPIVGRESELGRIGALLAAGETRVLLLEGDLGIGKSTLLQAGVAAARRRGFTVLEAAPGEGEAALVFATLGDLLEPVAGAVLPALAPPQRRALEVALLRAEPDAGRVDRRAVAAGLLSALRVLADERRVLVALDDAQWADAASLHALEFAARRLDDTAVRMLWCARTPAGTALAGAHVERVAVAPLTARACSELVARRVPALASGTRHRILRAAAGNPLFAIELGRAAQQSGAGAAIDAVDPPRRLRELLRARLETLSPPARRVLLVVASALAPTVALVGEAAGIPAAQLDAPELAGVVMREGGRIRFAHPLYKAAVEALATAEERRALHSRLAALVGDPDEQARHLALAAAGPDARLAGRLDGAAERARMRGAPEVAVELAARALALTPVDAAGAADRRVIRLARHEFHAGEAAAARRRLQQVVGAIRDPAVQGEALWLLGTIGIFEESVTGAIGRLERAAVLVGEDPDARCAIETQLTYAALVTFRLQAADAHAARALALADAVAEPGLRAEALAVRATTTFAIGGDRGALLEEALRLEDPDRAAPVAMRPSMIAGCIRLYEGRLADGVAILEPLRERCGDRGDDAGRGHAAAQLSWAHAWAGSLGTAAALAAEGVADTERVGSDSLLCCALAFGALAHAYRGDVDRTRDHVGRAGALGATTSMQSPLLWAGWAQGVLALSQDDPAEAVLAFAPWVAAASQHGLAEPMLLPFAADAVEALLRVGEAGPARAVAALAREAARARRRGWALAASARMDALLLADAGDLADAAAAAEEAVLRGEQTGLALETARSRLLAGVIARRRRRRAAAAEHLESALDAFTAAGAAAWASRTRAELDRTGLTRLGDRNELTESERRVAELVATGATNREVAAALFISPKTVDAHLGRAYRKLGVNSRAQLGAHFGK